MPPQVVYKRPAFFDRDKTSVRFAARENHPCERSLPGSQLEDRSSLPHPGALDDQAGEMFG